MQVASYSDYRRAVRAVEHLIELDQRPEGVCVVLHDFRRVPVAPPAPFGRRFVRAWAVVAPASLALFLALLWSPGVRLTGAGGALGITIVVAAIVSAVVALVSAARNGRGLRRTALVPGRYDITAADEPDAAERALAQWWETDLQPPVRTPDDQRVVARR